MMMMVLLLVAVVVVVIEVMDNVVSVTRFNNMSPVPHLGVSDKVGDGDDSDDGDDDDGGGDVGEGLRRDDRCVLG